MAIPDQLRAQTAALEFLSKNITKDDMVSIMLYTSQLQVKTDFTSDRDLLSNIINKLPIGEMSELAGLADDGSGGTTLREAIQEANSTGGADTIVFQSGLSGTITLTGGQLAIDDDVTITGPGSGSLTVDADGASRAFLLYLYLGSFEVNISGLTITGGAGAMTGLAQDIPLPPTLHYGEANGPWEVRARIRDLAHRGADHIKLLSTGAVLTHGSNPKSIEFTPEELSAAVQEAGSFGLKVAAPRQEQRILAGVEHAGEVIERRIGIRAAHRFMQRGDQVVVAVLRLIVDRCPALHHLLQLLIFLLMLV